MLVYPEGTLFGKHLNSRVHSCGEAMNETVWKMIYTFFLLLFFFTTSMIFMLAYRRATINFPMNLWRDILYIHDGCLMIIQLQ